MKSVKIFKVGLFALLCFANHNVYAQSTPIHKVLYADSIVQSWGLAGGDISVNSYDSLLLTLHLAFPNDSQQVTALTAFRKSNLSIKNQINIDTISLTIQSSIFDPDNNRNFTIIREKNGNSTWIRYHYNPNTGNLTKQEKSHPRPLPGILNHWGNEFIGYTYFASSGFLQDSFKLVRYDLLGDIKNSRVTLIDSGFKSKFPHYGRSMQLALALNPNDTNEFVIGNTSLGFIATFNRDSLTIKHLMSKPSLNFPILPRLLMQYRLTKNKIMAFGQGSYCNNCNSNPNPIRQSYYIERAWDGTLLKEITPGDTAVPETGVPMAYDAANNTSYLASASPFRNILVDGQEFREVVIYRLNPFGRDSIRLFGQKNHLPRRLRYDGQNGDLFLVSAHTNAWTDRASFITVTKIPNFILSLIEDNKIEADIHIYPNPAQDYIKVEAFRENIKQIEVYNQSGQLLKSVHNPGVNLNVSALSKGIYVVVVTNDEGKRYSSLLKKN